MMCSREIILPAERKVPIVTTSTNDWISVVAEAVTREDPHKRQSVLIQSGDGPYILGTGFYIEEKLPIAMQMLNRQKERPLDQLVALGIPREEMALWVASNQRPLVERLTSALSNEVFGVIAQANPVLPDWLTKFDKLHKTREKLTVWCDRLDLGPTAQLFRYIRNNLGLPPDRFTMLFTSANLRGKGTQTRLVGSYEQLGDKDNIVAAVMDIEEDKYQKGSPPIISTLPFIVGYNRFLVVNARRGIDDLQGKLTELETMSKLSLVIYSLRAFGYTTFHSRAA